MKRREKKFSINSTLVICIALLLSVISFTCCGVARKQASNPASPPTPPLVINKTVECNSHGKYCGLDRKEYPRIFKTLEKRGIWYFSKTINKDSSLRINLSNGVCILTYNVDSIFFKKCSNHTDIVTIESDCVYMEYLNCKHLPIW